MWSARSGCLQFPRHRWMNRWSRPAMEWAPRRRALEAALCEGGAKVWLPSRQLASACVWAAEPRRLRQVDMTIRSALPAGFRGGTPELGRYDRSETGQRGTRHAQRSTTRSVGLTAILRLGGRTLLSLIIAFLPC